MAFLARPLALFRRVAIAEVITWALLLFGMFLKYVTKTTDLGVRVFGMVHGIVFITFVVSTVIVWVDQRWSARRGFGVLFAAIPPFATYVAEVLAVRRNWIGDHWRLRANDGVTVPERTVHWILVAPLRGLAVALAFIVVLTGMALTVGPPTSW